jgi:hypothetical protein
MEATLIAPLPDAAALHRLLTQAVVESLENMAFIAPEPFAETRVPSDQRLIRVCISFCGPLVGIMEIICPRALGENLACTIFCMEPADDEIVLRGQDALHELCNITCGTFLRNIARQLRCHFDMHLPILRPFDPNETPDDLNVTPDCLAITAEGHPMLVRLQYRSHSETAP